MICSLRSRLRKIHLKTSRADSLWLKSKNAAAEKYLGTAQWLKVFMQRENMANNFRTRRQWHPTPVLLPRKSHGRRSLIGCSPWGRQSRTRLSDFTFTFHFHALEKEMATHASVLAWRIPGTGSLVGCRLWVAQSRTRLKRLSSSSTNSLGLPGGASGKEPACQCRRHKGRGFSLWVGMIPWRRAWLPTPVFLSGESPWMEQPCGLQSLGSQRVGLD